MAKGKPNLAFLEALKHDKRRRGDSSPGGAFKTPDWFHKTPAAPAAPEPKVAIGPAQNTRKGFRVTYVHAAIAGAAVLLIVTAAFFAGRRPASDAQPDAHANVAVPTGRVAVTPQATVTPPPAAPAQAPAAPAPPASANGARTPGMLYVVFQSYKDEKLATQARDALLAGGIGATVEKGLDYAPTWYVVVGTQGFTRTNAPDYLQYVNKSKAISEKFAGKNKWWAFEPNAYKWKGK